MKPSSQLQNKKYEKTKLYEISVKPKAKSPRELLNFSMKKTPDRASWNAIRCRIFCSIHWCSRNVVQLPKTEKKYEKGSFKNWKWFHVAVATRIPKFLHEVDIRQSLPERHSMQPFVLYSVVPSEWSQVAKNAKKIRKENFRNCKWFDVALATRSPRFLYEADTWQSFTEHHWMQNFVLYSGCFQNESQSPETEKNMRKKESFRNWKWFDVAVASKIAKFLYEEGTLHSFPERESMRNFVLYSVMLSQWSSVAKNTKETNEKEKILGIASGLTSHSPREFQNFSTKEAPDRASRNAIRCRI